MNSDLIHGREPIGFRGTRWVRILRRVGITLGGFAVLALGVAMLFLPGPGLLVIPAGLTILASEYTWARSLLNKVKERIHRLRRRSGKSGALA